MKSGLPALFLLMLMTADIFGGAGVSLPYVGLGFRHIIPEGIDHVFFVLGLFFLSRSIVALFWQITAFTVAHSLTFGLALYGVVEVPARAVEVTVALSISFIAVENLLTARLSFWRPFVVFAFGLVHGLAFAHTFREEAVPHENLMAALFSFNVGVELGQLAVVGVALLIVASFWQRTWYRNKVAMPASALIAVTGLYWAVERMFTA
jgi:HupE / UreJ protein